MKAISKNIGISSKKLKPYIDLVRDKNINEALILLRYQKSPAAFEIHKTIESAIANAEHNQGLDVDSLFVSTIAVDESFTMKRIRARARGRADRYFKRSCNISLTLEDKGK